MLNNTAKVLLLILFLAALPSAHALGIGPAKTQADFKPDTQYKLDFFVTNELDQSKKIELYVAGDSELAQYVKLPATVFTLRPKEIRGLSLTINFPSDAKPGQHKLRIGAVESAGREGQIGARVGVEMFLLVDVPIPGKYIVIDRFDVQDSRVGRPALLNLIVTNKGKEKISKIAAVADILNARGEKAITTILTFADLEPTKSATLSMLVKTDDFPAGKYRAKATIDYDGIKTIADTEFRVRDLLINVLRIHGADIKKDQIGKILIEFESLWDGTISNIRPIIKITKEGAVVAQLSGEETAVQPYGAGIATVYWDTHGLEAGAYGVEATLYFGNKTAVGQGTVVISGANTITIALISIALALIVLSYLFIIRKRKYKR